MGFLHNQFLIKTFINCVIGLSNCIQLKQSTLAVHHFLIGILFRQQCEPIEEEVCSQIEDKECSDEIETKCETVDEVIEEEICSDVPREDCQLITDQECNTVEEEICDDTTTVSILDILLQKIILYT